MFWQGNETSDELTSIYDEPSQPLDARSTVQHMSVFMTKSCAKKFSFFQFLMYVLNSIYLKEGKKRRNLSFLKYMSCKY